VPLPRSRPWQLLLVFVLALGVVLPAAWRAPGELEGDERGFVEYGMLQAELYLDCLRGTEGAWSDFRWGESYGHYGRNNPKLGLYLVGAMGHATASIEDPARRVLALRLLMGLLAAACAVAAAALGARRLSPLAAWLAAAWLLASPVFRSVQVALLTEIPMLLFALLSLATLEQASGWGRGRRWAWLAASGVLAGLAISCKLTALALLPAVGLVLVFRRGLTWRCWLAVAGGWLAGAALFVVSNPYLAAQPLEALGALTTGHVSSLGGEPWSMAAGGDSLAYLLWVPFLLVRPGLEAHQQLLDLQPGLLYLAGLLLCALGLGLSLARRRLLPAAWLLSSLLLTAYVVTRFPESWLYPKVFLLPSVAVAWCFAFVDPSASRR